MLFIHVDPSTHNEKQINQFIEDGKDVFLLIYMEGCGPCNATRPEWKKLENVFAGNKNDNVVIADVDKELLPSLKHVGDVAGFPTVKYIGNRGKTVEAYEDSAIPSEKNRSIDSFAEWIRSKTQQKTGGKKWTGKRVRNHLTRRAQTKRHRRNRHRGGKWSLKYKRSINCRRPRGFSQRQHCKYGRRS